MSAAKLTRDVNAELVSTHPSVASPHGGQLALKAATVLLSLYDCQAPKLLHRWCTVVTQCVTYQDLFPGLHSVSGGQLSAANTCAA